jgi:hypothetical protein
MEYTSEGGAVSIRVFGVLEGGFMNLITAEWRFLTLAITVLGAALFLGCDAVGQGEEPDGDANSRQVDAVVEAPPLEGGSNNAEDRVDLDSTGNLRRTNPEVSLEDPKPSDASQDDADEPESDPLDPETPADTSTDDGDVERLCEKTECCFDVAIDPAPVSLSPFQIQRVTESAYPVPDGVPLESDLLLIRAKWRDVFADPSSGVCQTPCGGHCVPSGGKVYLVDTRTDAVRFVGDEDTETWKSWGPAIVHTPTIYGYEVELDDGKLYYFNSTDNAWQEPAAGNGTVRPWAVCFLTVGRNGRCIHFPLTADPGPCPLDVPEYLMSGGQCPTF